jgi:hypothetical protein
MLESLSFHLLAVYENNLNLKESYENNPANNDWNPPKLI